MKKDFSRLRVKGEFFSLLITLIFFFLIYFFLIKKSFFLIIILTSFYLFLIILNQKIIQGNAVLINEEQFSEINKIIKETAEFLEMEKPQSFLVFSPELNAFAMGFKKPYTLVLYSALVETLTPDELRFVIGHELGHIKMGHTKIISFFQSAGKHVPFVSLVFLFWSRKAEYTADRLGFLATNNNLQESINAVVKLITGKNLFSKINMNALLNQIKIAYDERIEKWAEILTSHPFITNRIKALINFSIEMQKKQL